MKKETDDPYMFLANFKKCKIAAIDRAYEGTSQTIGAHQARMALKYVLLNDETALEGMKPIDDKYLYISSKYGGRDFLRMVSHVDIIHILAKFAMAFFALEGIPFKLNDDSFEKTKKKDQNELSTRELIEFIAYSSYKSHSETYKFLSKNNSLAVKLLNLLIDYRYKKLMAGQLDNFDGNFNENKTKIDIVIKNRYYLQYQNIDEEYKKLRQGQK